MRVEILELQAPPSPVATDTNPVHNLNQSVARKLTRHVTLKVERRFQGQETLETERGTDHQTVIRLGFHSFHEIDDLNCICTKNLPQNYILSYTCKMIIEIYFLLISIFSLESQHSRSHTVVIFKFGPNF